MTIFYFLENLRSTGRSSAAISAVVFSTEIRMAIAYLLPIFIRIYSMFTRIPTFSAFSCSTNFIRILLSLFFGEIYGPTLPKSVWNLLARL